MSSRTEVALTSLQIAERLGQTGLCICPDFLTPDSLRDVRHDLDVLKAGGLFKAAGVGQGHNRKIRNFIRRDEVYWLDRELSTPAQLLLWNKLDVLKAALNQTLFLGIQSFDGHYAAYPKGGFYKRHRDCLPRNNDRVVSVILYLNKGWKSTDGGRLRFFDESAHLDIDPVGGTLVCFMSEDSEHEVLLSHSSRYSFTGWFKTGTT